MLRWTCLIMVDMWHVMISDLTFGLLPRSVVIQEGVDSRTSSYSFYVFYLMLLDIISFPCSRQRGWVELARCRISYCIVSVAATRLYAEGSGESIIIHYYHNYHYMTLQQTLN